MITSRKITAFTKKVADLPDKTSGAFTAAQAKAQFDAAPEELRVAHNGLIDDLGATTAGDSGAKGIGVSTIAGVTGANVQAVVEDLKLQINGAVAGSIPDGSITQSKLAFTIATNAGSVTISDTGNHFTATNVEGALDELFQSASSVKTNVANAIGAPATSSDTGTVLANRITTEKGRLAAEIGDGDSTSALQYLADRLIVRSDAVATAVNGKGVAATSTDTLAQLATKIGQIISVPRTPGDVGQALTTLTEQINNNTTYARTSETITVGQNGTYRFKFNLRSNNGSTVYGRLYDMTSGVYIGTERLTISTTNVIFSEDIAITAGMKICVYARASVASQPAKVSSFGLYTAEPIVFKADTL